MDLDYSYIDVAALDTVRAPFAGGQALVIASLDLGEVIWANGPGAQLVGFPDIEAALGAKLSLPAIARRQIMSTPGFPELAEPKVAAVRLHGLVQRPIRLVLSTIALPDGEQALLIVASEAEPASHADAAARAISGFSGPGELVALLDHSGRPIAATPGFEQAGIDAAALAELANAPTAAHRVVKRHLTSTRGPLPAAMARLNDDPSLNFLIAIAPTETNTAAAAAPDADETAPADTIAAVPQNRALSAVHAISPVRFVWRTDADARFTSLSPEFSALIDVDESEIVGQPFRDIAARYGFDSDGEIAGLLERRDTWSGRSVLWPLGEVRVPVDLAALPVYDRNRTFEGFRGFGVARTQDAALAAPQQVAAAPVVTADETPEPITPEDEWETLSRDEALALFEDGPDADEPDFVEDEQPVAPLEVAPEDTRDDDKIIRLVPRRQAASERPGLSPGERTAFREIGDRLKATVPAEQVEQTVFPSEQVEEATSPSAIVEPAPVTEAPVAAETDEPKPVVASQPSDTDDDILARSAIEGTRVRRTAPPSVRRGRSEIAAVPGGRKIVTEGENGDLAPATTAAPDEAPEPPPLQPDAVSPVLDGAAMPEDLAAIAAQDPAPVAEAEVVAPAQAAFVGIEPLARDAPEELVPMEPLPARQAPSADTPATEEQPSSADSQALMDALPIAVIVHAGDRLDFANRAFFDLTGYESLESLSRAGGLDALFASTDQPEQGDSRLFLRTAEVEDIPVHVHLQSVPWGGSKSLMLTIRPAEVSVADEADVQPAPDNVLQLPLPERGGERAELVQTQALLDEMRTIVDTATDGVILINADGMIRSISRPAEALFGSDSGAVEGNAFTSLFAIESQRAIRDYLQGLTDNGVASVLNDGREVIGREAQGRFIPLFITIGRLPRDGGFCAVLRDITQWKRAEEELTQARAEAERTSSQKSEFLARVSHEIRTPLNAIIGFSELMMDERFGPIGSERYRDYLRDINRSGNHVLDLVNDLLDISKIEAGEQELSYVAVSLNDALGEAVAIMQPQANRERVIIRSSFASRLPDVVADLRSVRQIALNLLSNAVRYTQAGGQVIVSTVYEPNGEVILRIRDTGVGMSSAEIDQALRPFKQVNALKRARGDGTGLGLPLTKAMVEANRARFAIQSRPSEGTLIEITFPSTRVLAD